MISVERSFYEKFPQLAEGRARSFAQPVVELLRRVACEERINATIAAAAPLSGFGFVERVLEQFHIAIASRIPIARTSRSTAAS